MSGFTEKLRNILKRNDEIHAEMNKEGIDYSSKDYADLSKEASDLEEVCKEIRLFLKKNEEFKIGFFFTRKPVFY